MINYRQSNLKNSNKGATMLSKVSIFHYLLCSGLFVSALFADTNATSNASELDFVDGGGGLQLRLINLVR